MTPDKARALLDGTTPGPWEWREGKDQNGEFVALCGPDGVDALRTWDGDLYASGVHGTNADKALAAHAPDMAAMIAGMREEWGVKWDDDPNGPPDWGFPTRAAAEQWEKKHRHRGPGRGRIVRRYVTEPEAANATD